MLNAVYDKSAWLREREIDASWPAAGLPEIVHSDNGADFRSHAFAWACREEGIQLLFRPKGAPHYGGHIERLIGTTMGRVKRSGRGEPPPRPEVEWVFQTERRTDPSWCDSASLRSGSVLSLTPVNGNCCHSISATDLV